MDVFRLYSILLLIVCVAFQIIMNKQNLSGLIVYYRAAKPFELFFCDDKDVSKEDGEDES
jgi:hypothetical protein